MLDVETFLRKTLDKERLSKAARGEKDAILTKLKALQDEYPQLNTESDLNRENETRRTISTESPRQQPKQVTPSDDSGGEQYLWLDDGLGAIH